MRIEHSHLFASDRPPTDRFARLAEISAFQGGAPMQIAWTLESTALQKGWPVGFHLGTERQLIEKFGVCRDTLREAIRIMEARGAMQMQRGRVGGLQLLSPRVEDVASAFAAYLHAVDCTPEEFIETTRIAGPIIAALHDSDLAASLYRQSVSVFSNDKADGITGTNRAETIAARLVQQYSPIPECGVFLGGVAELSEKLGCTRPALREALGVLEDSSMLHIQRGRGGGATLVRPSFDGAVRRIFALIASQHLTLEGAVPAICALNRIRFRLITRQLCRMDDKTRRAKCDLLAELLERWPAADGWTNLQSELDRITNSKMVSVLAEGFGSYLARLGTIQVHYRELENMSYTSGLAQVHALHSANYEEAERLQEDLHSRITRLLNCTDIRITDHTA
jgi:DNA-binding FadR family transcriptional regulator